MSTRRPILMILILVGCVSVLACATVRKDRKIEFVYLALGASDATGVGALPLTEGYVFLIKRELDKRVPGVALVNLGVPGARVDLIKEQVRVATQINTKAHLVTLWTGANHLEPRRGNLERHEELFVPIAPFAAHATAIGSKSVPSGTPSRTTTCFRLG